MNFSLFPLLALCLLACPSSWAQKDKGDFTYDPKTKSVKPKYLGKVFLIKGKVESISSTGIESSLRDQSKIFPGDKIITQAKSLIKIEMVDTTVVTVAAESTFEFSKWDYETKDEREALFNVIKGRIRSNIKVKNKKTSSLKYQVGSVSMGIRGTRILASAYTRPDKVSVSHVVVLEGKTEIYDSAADKKLSLEAGSQYISFLKPDGTILKTEGPNLSREEVKRLKATDKNPRKYFRPFLPFIGLKKVSHSTSSKLAAPSPTGAGANRKNSRFKNNEKKSWKSTLNKLNQRLLENKND